MFTVPRHRSLTAGDVVRFNGQVVELKAESGRLVGVRVDDPWHDFNLAVDRTAAELLATSLDGYRLSVR